MGLVSDWIDSAQELITSPAEYFENENRRDSFGYPLKFAVISLLLVGIFSSAQVIISGNGVTTALIGLVSSIIGGVIGLFIGAAILHIFVALLGGENGFSETASVVEYVTVFSVVSTAFGLIPVVGGIASLLTFLYGLYAEVKGLEKFQGLSTGRAIAAILLPIVIVTIVAVVLAITVFAGTAASLAAMSP